MKATDTAFFVYRYDIAGIVSYIGKGTGTRNTDHIDVARRLVAGRPSSATPFQVRLAEAIRRGEPFHERILVSGLREGQALAIERELIAAHKRVHEGGTLLNVVSGDSRAAANESAPFEPFTAKSEQQFVRTQRWDWDCEMTGEERDDLALLSERNALGGFGLEFRDLEDKTFPPPLHVRGIAGQVWLRGEVLAWLRIEGQLDKGRLWDLSDMAQALGVSRVRFRLLAAHKRFPRPVVHLGLDKRPYWREESIGAARSFIGGGV